MADNTASFTFLREQILQGIRDSCNQVQSDMDELLDAINDADMAVRSLDAARALKILKDALPPARKRIFAMTIDVAKLTAKAHVQTPKFLGDGRN
jgi:hypothetical protein